MNPIIYTNEDVRPDLLTAEERAQFPEVLTNEHRRQILDITRLRIDTTDFRGKPILSPEEWMAQFSQLSEFEENQKIALLICDIIEKDVVIPYNGKVVKVDYGIADIVQQLMDRGLVINTDRCRSGMITDHPNERAFKDGLDNILKPGEHVYNCGEFDTLIINFPADNTLKHYNGELAVQLIKEAAKEAGLCITANNQTAKFFQLTMPFCMDGTSYGDLMHETFQLKQELEETNPAQLGVYETFRKAKEQVVNAHGGYAKFTDNMIQDRLSRFERAIQRLIIRNPEMNRNVNETMHYENFLKTTQMDELNKQMEKMKVSLYHGRVLPHAYDKYKESPEQVDDIARKAGYIDYIDYCIRKRPSENNSESKRWATFQMLEKEHLHPDHQGMLKLFRIHNGINREINHWRQKELRRMAIPVIMNYRKAGYPIDQLQDFFVVIDEKDNANIIANINGKTIERQAAEEDASRLAINICTPFEIALATYGKELGWKSTLITPVSRQTTDFLNLAEKDGTGVHPLNDGKQIYMVDEKTWQQAVALSHYENMPERLQDSVLLWSHPVKHRIYDYSPNEIQKRVTEIQQTIDNAVTDMKVISATNNQVKARCKIHGKQQLADTFSYDDFNPRHNIPVGPPGIHIKERYAEKKLSEVFSQHQQNGLKR